MSMYTSNLIKYNNFAFIFSNKVFHVRNRGLYRRVCVSARIISLKQLKMFVTT